MKGAFWVALLTLLVSGVGVARAAESATTGLYTISEISYSLNETGNTIMTIKGLAEQPPTFITYDLFDPLRVVIDIADGNFAEGLTLPLEFNSGAVASVQGTMINDQQPPIAKIEILLTADNQYTIKKADKDILITFANEPSTDASPEQNSSDQKTQAHAFDLQITEATVENEGDAVTVLIVAGRPITDYEQVVLPKSSSRSDRMYIDLHGASAPTLAPVIKVNSGALSQMRTSQKEQGTRIVFDSSLDQIFDYDIDTVPEGLRVRITTPKNEQDASASLDPIGTLLTAIKTAEETENLTMNATTKVNDSPVAKQLKQVGVSGDAFSNAGYDKSRVSVDFYKTNIENVFYLLKELSGRNFVVDDSVSGTVTLYLENVPWEFILDVVLNLKGLQKIEKFNTIVISPQSKDFAWPEDTASTEGIFEAPEQELVAQIDEQLSQPPEVIEAKMHIQKANELTQNKLFPEALTAYKEAFLLWPSNADLAKRIAAFCLTEMNNFVCAEDYAEKALTINDTDQDAALQLAIARANMGKDDAKIYFDKAIEGDRPSSPALLNYAAYLEDKNENEQALHLLSRYESLYERTLTSMITRARIFDKMSQPDKAEEIYKAVLMYTGFDLPPDLAKFIKGRLALREANPDQVE